MKYIMLFEDFNKVNEAYSEKLKDSLMAKFRIEKPTLAKQTILAYINKFEKSKDNALIVQKDITKYKWDEFERILDSLPVTNRIKAGKIDLNSGEEIYNKNGLRVYPGSTKTLCIRYGNGYSWCISARGEDNMYHHYRLDQGGSPYFVFDSNRSSEKTSEGFVDPLHAVVVFKFDSEERVGYSLSNADNSGDEDFDTIDEMIQEYPYLGPVKNLFKDIALTDPKDVEHATDKLLYSSFNQVLEDTKLKEKIKRGTGFEYMFLEIYPSDLAGFKIAASGKTTGYYIYNNRSVFSGMMFLEGNPNDESMQKTLYDRNVKRFLDMWPEKANDPNQMKKAVAAATPGMMIHAQSGMSEPCKIIKLETADCKNVYDAMERWFVESKKLTGDRDPVKAYDDYRKLIDE